MRVTQNFVILYILMVIGQVIMCNYTYLGPYIMLSMLPAMILCLPTKFSTITCMFIAFASGFAVDWLSEGLIGINIASLVPVALARNGVIKIFLGEDLITRGDRFSFRKNGISKISAAVIILLAIYLGIYIFLDGAGSRPSLFNLTKFGLSLSCSFIISLIIINVLTPDDRK